ncbi:MAG: peptide deformylase [Clostridiales bacterium]|nr:peptide deformylase [Clostridiales bacterium]
MALRNIRIYGDEILKKKCRPVQMMTPRTKLLIRDMLDTMYEANGVGLAAPQVGILKRIVVIDVSGAEDDADGENMEGVVTENADDNADISAGGCTNESTDEGANVSADASAAVSQGGPYVLINPEILETAGEQTGQEGCLSLPGQAGNVTRPEYVKVKALDENMKEVIIEGKGLLARAICHECDHLEGIMYVEKVEGDLFDVTDGEE